MPFIETSSDLADFLADKLGIYGEERSLWTADLGERMRKAVINELQIVAGRQAITEIGEK